MDPAADDDRIWINYSRRRALPISVSTSAVVHITIIAAILLGFLSLFGRNEPTLVEFEPVIIAEAPGGGAGGTDAQSGFGEPTKPPADVAGVVAPQSRLPLKIPNEPLPEVKREQPTEPVSTPTDHDPRSPLERRFDNLPQVTSVRPLLKGLLEGPPGKTGIGHGAGKGIGTGPGVGEGDGSAGRLTQKQKRQLRWTLLFSVRGSADYLDQLSRMKAIIGVQYQDKSIKLITNLRQRPAQLESGDRVPDRIFWMDDNPEGVRSMAEELGIKPVPWRVIAFFPANLEDELLRKEKAFGKRFGRESEDDFQETVFRVDERYGNIDISVIQQSGKK
jgi:hypothetical protein